MTLFFFGCVIQAHKQFSQMVEMFFLLHTVAIVQTEEKNKAKWRPTSAIILKAY